MQVTEKVSLPTWNSDEVAAKLERIVKAVRKAVSEVAIVNYQDSVA